MLTAKGDDMDKILGLEYGADDYMTKPFNILELKARIKTILRRVTPPAAPAASTVVSVKPANIVTVGEISVDMDKRSVTAFGKPINLTAKEFDLLQLFITNKGKVFSRDQLLDMLWKPTTLGVRARWCSYSRLREKFVKNSASRNSSAQLGGLVLFR
jgi:DNA-binding response OmpR family regulator